VPASESPEQLIHDLSLQGVEIVSLNPVRSTLEDYFIAAVGESAPRDRAGVGA
jgi:hypothetical protein